MLNILARIAELAQHCVQSNIQPLLAAFFPQCSLVPQSSDAFMWWKRKHESSDQAIVHCSVVQFWCSQARCWCFRARAEVSMGNLTVLLCGSKCIMCSNTFISEPDLTSLAIWALVAWLLDQTIRVILASLPASMICFYFNSLNQHYTNKIQITHMELRTSP